MSSYLNVEESSEVKAAFETTNLTLSVPNEDHTLGNALRSMLSSRLDVAFAGYSIPHPTETFFNLRIQTANGKPAMEVLDLALKDLCGMTYVILERFEAGVASFQAREAAVETVMGEERVH